MKTADIGAVKGLRDEIVKTDWDVMVVHLLGVDHAGHTYGALSSELTS